MSPVGHIANIFTPVAAKLEREDKNKRLGEGYTTIHTVIYTVSDRQPIHVWVREGSRLPFGYTAHSIRQISHIRCELYDV